MDSFCAPFLRFYLWLRTFLPVFRNKKPSIRMAFLLAPFILSHSNPPPLFGQQPPLLTGRRVPAAGGGCRGRGDTADTWRVQATLGATSGFPEASLLSFGGSRRRSLSINEIGSLVQAKPSNRMAFLLAPLPLLSSHQHPRFLNSRRC